MTAPGQERIINAMEHEFEKEMGDWPREGLIERLLAALIEPTTETCPTCHGTGEVHYEVQRVHGLDGEMDVHADQCPQCSSVGTVPGPPLAYLAADRVTSEEEER